MIRREEVYKIGRLGKTHGVRGEISFLLDDDVFDRTDADYLILDIDGILVPFFIEEYRFKTDSNALMKFDGIDTQERARELTGCDVYFPRSLADEDEMNVSWAELVGYSLIDSNSGKTVGEIAAIEFEKIDFYAGKGAEDVKACTDTSVRTRSSMISFFFILFTNILINIKYLPNSYSDGRWSTAQPINRWLL